jgi:hypothetical protein
MKKRGRQIKRGKEIRRKRGRREQHTRIMAEKMRDSREKEKRAKTREEGSLEKEERVTLV